MKTFSFCIFILLGQFVLGQNITTSIEEAKNLAFQKEYSLAIVKLDSMLVINPNNKDLVHLKSNMYSWQGNHDSAIAILSKIDNDSLNVETKNLIALNKFRASHYNEALAICQYILSKDTMNTSAKMLELDILFQQKQYNNCYVKAKNIIPATEKSILLLKLCLQKITTESISLGYSLQKNQDKSNSLYSAQFQTSGHKITSISKVQFATNSQTQGIQVQQEVYKKWKKHGYSYLGASYAIGDLFAPYSIAAVHFYPVKKATELDLGIRYYAGRNNNYSLVPSIGASQTIGKMLINYRYYKLIGPTISGYTHSFSAKRYLARNEDYIKIDVSLGNQLTENNQLNNYYTLSSKGFSLNVNYFKTLSNRTSLNASILYANAVLNESNQIKQITTNITLTYKFSIKNAITNN